MWLQRPGETKTNLTLFMYVSRIYSRWICSRISVTRVFPCDCERSAARSYTSVHTTLTDKTNSTGTMLSIIRQNGLSGWCVTGKRILALLFSPNLAAFSVISSVLNHSKMKDKCISDQTAFGASRSLSWNCSALGFWKIADVGCDLLWNLFPDEDKFRPEATGMSLPLLPRFLCALPEHSVVCILQVVMLLV